MHIFQRDIAGLVQSNLTPSLTILFEDPVFAVTISEPRQLGQSDMLDIASSLFQLTREGIDVNKATETQHNVRPLFQYSGEPFLFSDSIFMWQVQPSDTYAL